MQIKNCLKTIEDDWLSLNTDSERAILQRHTTYGQYLTIFYAGAKKEDRWKIWFGKFGLIWRFKRNLFGGKCARVLKIYSFP